MLTVLDYRHVYAPQCFIGQRHELEQIEKRVEEARRGVLVDAINYFWGIGGMGKSWLLNHLQHLYRFDPAQTAASSPTDKPTFTLAVCFDTPSSFSWPWLVKKLATAALAQLAAVPLEEAVHAWLREAAASGEGDKLLRALRHLTRQWVPMLLLDGADRLAADDWGLVERQLLEPLAVSGRVVIALSGRRAALRWQRFEARRRVANHPLEPFDLELARQLVAHVDPPYSPMSVVETFFACSAGIPALIRALAGASTLYDHYAVEQPQLNPQPSPQTNPNSHQTAISALENGRHTALLQLVVQAEATILADVPAHLRPLLRQIIPLRFYRISSLRAMLEESDPATPAAPDSHYLQILRDLEQTGIIWWDRALRAYVAALPLRRLVATRQWLADQGETAATLNQHAIDMYWRWAKDDPQSCEIPICELWYHLAMVAVAGGHSHSRRAGWLQPRVTAALNFARAHLTPSQLHCLHNRLAADKELQALLPSPLRRDLLAQLSKAAPRSDMTNVLAFA